MTISAVACTCLIRDSVGLTTSADCLSRKFMMEGMSLMAVQYQHCLPDRLNFVLCTQVVFQDEIS